MNRGKAENRRSRGPSGLASLLSPVLLGIAPFLTGCQEGEPSLSPEDGERVVQVAGPAASELLRTLVGRLTAAVQEGGTAQAAEFCSTDALPLTRMVEAGLQGGLTLKRTTFRYRNPANAPDQAEEEALVFFEKALRERGSAPSHFVQRVSEEELRYYQPLFVGEFCLQCHGDPERLSPDVQRVLTERYPEDLATGYEAGDFRGVVRVSVPDSSLSEAGLAEGERP